MRRWFVPAFLSLACVWAAAAAIADTPGPTELELANDGGPPFGFVGGFLAGEIAAARLIPESVPVTLDRVRLVFGPDGSGRDVTLHVWDDSAELTAPGAALYSDSFTLTASGDQFQEIDLSTAAIVIDGPFRVGVEFTGAGLPSVARDTDGTSDPALDYIFAQGVGWKTSTQLGLSGDWVIRAVVVPEPAGGVAAALVALAAFRRRRRASAERC